jgi:hypothetical protein
VTVTQINPDRRKVSMFPFSYIFSRSSRPQHQHQRSVLDEEYEWVFGRKSPSAQRSSRPLATGDRERSERDSR